MDSKNSFVGILCVDEYGNFNFAGRNHLNIYIAVVKSFKHF